VCRDDHGAFGLALRQVSNHLHVQFFVAMRIVQLDLDPLLAGGHLHATRNLHARLPGEVS
jgi:hypothetical protein